MPTDKDDGKEGSGSSQNSRSEAADTHMSGPKPRPTFKEDFLQVIQEKPSPWNPIPKNNPKFYGENKAEKAVEWMKEFAKKSENQGKELVVKCLSEKAAESLVMAAAPHAGAALMAIKVAAKFNDRNGNPMTKVISAGPNQSPEAEQKRNLPPSLDPRAKPKILRDGDR